jgi:hypothetical protein
MSKFRKFVAAAGLALSFAAPSAFAYDWNISDAKVTLVVADSMPNYVYFMVDKPGGQCPAGYFLTYTPAGSDQNTKFANANAVYSSLLSAMMTGRTISIYGNNAGCVITTIHIK